MELKLILTICVTLIYIQTSEGKSKRKSEGLLIIPTCIGRRLPSKQYNWARKGCKKRDKMCAYVCIFEKLKVIKNNQIDEAEQRRHAVDVLPPKAVENVLKELRACRGKYNKNDKSSDCDGNHSWAVCNRDAVKTGCKKSE